MTSSHRVAIIVVLACLGCSSQATAQSDDDWDVATVPVQQLTVASVEYANGVSVIAQCRSGNLQAAILGLPQATPGRAWYDFRLSTGLTTRKSLERQEDGSTLLSKGDDRLVRFLKGAGRLSLSSDAEATAPFHLQVDLPASSQGLDAVLSACGYPSVNDRDALPSVEELLTDLPRPTMPDRVVERRARAGAGPNGRGGQTFQVTISCVVADGRFMACRSEHEIPANPADGQITAAVLEGTQAQVSDVAAAEGRVLDLVLTGSRIRR